MVKEDLTKQNMDVHTYLMLYSPALDFILQAIAANASEVLLNDILDKCKKNGNR